MTLRKVHNPEVHFGDNRAKQSKNLKGGKAVKYWPEKPNLARNDDIVEATTVLIAAPKQTEEIRRSGTWATVRRARKQHQPIYYAFA